jgi:hypothetical protein
MAPRQNKGKTENSVVITMRCPREVRDGLQKLADDDNRTLNGYLTHILTQHVSKELKRR